MNSKFLLKPDTGNVPRSNRPDISFGLGFREPVFLGLSFTAPPAYVVSAMASPKGSESPFPTGSLTKGMFLQLNSLCIEFKTRQHFYHFLTWPQTRFRA